jgi:Zn-dependent peptidase ImmA (M78 family)/DNA-binding Xre family transcriptional regulator
VSRGGIQGFQKDRLIQILAARRLSQVQLAALVGVSTATISKWRSGAQVPIREALDRLSDVVNVTPEWFTRPMVETTSMPLFRSNASAHVSARSMLRARLEWVQEIALALGEFVDFPELRLPKRMFREPEEITPEDIEQAACECREMWGLGRVVVEDLALAVEGAGVIVVREETGITQIEGLSAWSDVLGRPIILLSADKANGFRSRFDLAHELGHLVLHKYMQRTNDRERHNLMERQAHGFAGAFLLPAESFAPEVHLPVTLDDLLLLKRRWGVSVGALIKRLEAMELLDEFERVSLYKKTSFRWGRKSEPGDGDRAPEQPRLLRRTIDLLVDEKVMPLDSIPRHIGLGASDIESLSGLPEGYFQGRSNLVQFARMKSARSQLDERVAEDNSVVVPFRTPSKT